MSVPIPLTRKRPLPIKTNDAQPGHRSAIFHKQIADSL